MIALSSQIKKIRDDAGTTIVNLHLAQKLTEEEMHFLLTMLDIVIKNEDCALIPVLHTWMPRPNNSEIDNIIKATLLGLDFSDQAAMERTCSSIRELAAD